MSGIKLGLISIDKTNAIQICEKALENIKNYRIKLENKEVKIFMDKYNSKLDNSKLIKIEQFLLRKKYKKLETIEEAKVEMDKLILKDFEDGHICSKFDYRSCCFREAFSNAVEILSSCQNNIDKELFVGIKDWNELVGISNW